MKEARRAAGFSDVELRYLETGSDWWQSGTLPCSNITRVLDAHFRSEIGSSQKINPELTARSFQKEITNTGRWSMACFSSGLEFVRLFFTQRLLARRDCQSASKGTAAASCLPLAITMGRKMHLRRFSPAVSMPFEYEPGKNAIAAYAGAYPPSLSLFIHDYRSGFGKNNNLLPDAARSKRCGTTANKKPRKGGQYVFFFASASIRGASVILQCTDTLHRTGECLIIANFLRQ
jgi:hypothetical protein